MKIFHRVLHLVERKLLLFRSITLDYSKIFYLVGMISLAQTDLILFLMAFLAIFHIFHPSFDANFMVWHRQGANNRSENGVADKEISFIMQTGLQLSSFLRHDYWNLTGVEHLYFSKLRTISSIAWSGTKERKFMHIVLMSQLHLFFLGNILSVGNVHGVSAGLIKLQLKCLSGKACLNILGTENVRSVGA